MNRILYIVEDKEIPQFRYRVKNIIDALEDSKNWAVEYVLKSGINDLKLELYSLIVVERQADKDGRISCVIKKAQRLGVKVLMDLDDLVFN